MAEDAVSLTNASLDGGSLTALLEASVAINSTLDLEDVLQAIARSAADVLDAEDKPSVLWKKGFYTQVEVPTGKYLTLVGRVDGLLREEDTPMTLPGEGFDESSGIVRWTGGINVAPTLDYSFRLQWETYRFTDFENTNVVRVGAVATN